MRAESGEKSIEGRERMLTIMIRNRISIALMRRARKADQS